MPLAIADTLASLAPSDYPGCQPTSSSPSFATPPSRSRIVPCRLDSASLAAHITARKSSGIVYACMPHGEGASMTTASLHMALHDHPAARSRGGLRIPRSLPFRPLPSPFHPLSPLCRGLVITALTVGGATSHHGVHLFNAGRVVLTRISNRASRGRAAAFTPLLLCSPATSSASAAAPASPRKPASQLRYGSLAGKINAPGYTPRERWRQHLFAFGGDLSAH